MRMILDPRSSDRVLYNNHDLLLSSKIIEGVEYWIAVTENESMLKDGFYRTEGNNIFIKILSETGFQNPLFAFTRRQFCIYKGYLFNNLHLIGDNISIAPGERRTYFYLYESAYKNIYRESEFSISMPYEKFIASNPTIWEERYPIRDFEFNVEPFVYLYKDKHYIEENIGSAWSGTVIG